MISEICREHDAANDKVQARIDTYERRLKKNRAKLRGWTSVI